MATFTWEVYANTPGWMGVGANYFVFSGSATDLTVPITVGSWNSGTHIGNGEPGTDQCGSTHVPNIEYISSTQYSKNGGGATALTALTQTDCSLRVMFTDASTVATSNARFYTFDGTTETNEAVGIEAYAFEYNNGTTWTMINDDSGNTGGDNSGERLELADQGTPSTDHYFYIAVSARPESVGSKTQFDFGIALTYS